MSSSPHTPIPTAFRLLPLHLLTNDPNTTSPSQIISYKCDYVTKPGIQKMGHFRARDAPKIILSLDSLCNIRMINMNTQQMSIYAIATHTRTRAFQKPLTDWCVYDERVVMLQRFDNKVYYADLRGIMDVESADDAAAYARYNLIQIAQHDTPVRAVSVQLHETQRDESSIDAADVIRYYLMITGTETGQCRVWRFRDGDPPRDMQCLFEVSAHKYQISCVAVSVFQFMRDEKRILAVTGGMDRVLKVWDVLKREWYTEKPIEHSMLRLMKVLTMRSGEQMLCTVNALGSVLLYSIRNNMALVQSIYVNLGGNATYQVSDISTFVDPYTKKDVLVVPCCDTRDSAQHLLKFYVDGVLMLEYPLPQPVLFCTIFDNLQPNQQHLVVGNSAGLIDAWDVRDIMRTEDVAEEDEEESEESSLEKTFEEELQKQQGDWEDSSVVEDSEEGSTSSTTEPQQCPSPRIQPRRQAVPEPMRDSRVGGTTRNAPLEESFSALPRRTIPQMHTKEDMPAARSGVPQPHPSVTFTLPPNTPRERSDAPRPTIQPQQPQAEFLMPSISPKKQSQPPIQYPSQPKPAVIKHAPPLKSDESYDNRVHYSNPTEFMNVLEQQAEEEEHPERYPQHPLAQPRAFTTKLIEKQIEELENEEFDPEKYLREKQVVTDKDAAIHGYQFDQKDALYTDLPSVGSPTSEVSRTRRRKVPKQVSQAYLDEQRAQAPRFDELIFLDELQEEVKCDVDSALFDGSQWWKTAAGKTRDQDIDDPLNAPLNQHTAHRFVKYFMQNPHWFHE